MAEDRPGSVWLRRERAGRGPAPEHDRARIAAAAIALADAGGLDSVSMRKVAAAIGAGAATLYRYVDNRDEVLELMADAVSGELDLSRPPSGDWVADLLGIAHQIRDVYRRHPWMLDISPGRTSPGLNTVDWLEYSLDVLAGLDVPAGTKLEAVAMMNGVVALVTRTELATDGATAAWQEAQAEFLRAVVNAGRHPHLAAAFGGAAAARPGHQDLLDRVLPRMLHGLLAPT